MGGRGDDVSFVQKSDPTQGAALMIVVPSNYTLTRRISGGWALDRRTDGDVSYEVARLYAEFDVANWGQKYSCVLWQSRAGEAPPCKVSDNLQELITWACAIDRLGI